MIGRGKIRRVIAAGSLAAGLKKAAMEIEGKQFDLGLSQDRGAQGQALLHSAGADRAGEADAHRGTGEGDRVRHACRFRAPGRQGFRARSGPATSSSTWALPPARFTKRRWAISSPRTRPTSRRRWCFTTACSACSRTRDFEEGTRKFIAQLKRMTDAGIKVYVGGGEGGAAIEKYGQPDWITYCFTAGGNGAQRPGQRAGALPGRVKDGGRSDGALPA